MCRAEARSGVPPLISRAFSNWVNSEPLTLDGLRGKVVLVDFWTYTCVNCIRTLSYLKDWHDKYADSGLVIVGVHTPEFEFEHLTENVAAASESFGLEYPIAQDNDFATWRAYSNRAWPAKYLVDKDGVVRYKHIGEGKYTETEFRIRQLLEDAGADLSGIELEVAADPQLDPAGPGLESGELADPVNFTAGITGITRPSVYTLAQPKYYKGPDQVLEYTDPGDHANGNLYLLGCGATGRRSFDTPARPKITRTTLP